MPIPQATEEAITMQNQCCEAAFISDDPNEKKFLLMACPQTYSWTETTGSCDLVSLNPDGSNHDIATGQDAADCCQAYIDGDAGAFQTDPLKMACDTEDSFIWNDNMSECKRITTFFDSNNMPLSQATEEASANQIECCIAAFNSNDPTEKATLLMACSQTYSWTEMTGSCDLISLNPSGQDHDIAMGQDAANCCQAYIDGDAGA